MDDLEILKGIVAGKINISDLDNETKQRLTKMCKEKLQEIKEKIEANKEQIKKLEEQINKK